MFLYNYGDVTDKLFSGFEFLLLINDIGQEINYVCSLEKRTSFLDYIFIKNIL